MATSTPGMFAGKMFSFASTMPRLATVGTEAVAYEFKKTAKAFAPDRLSNMGRRGVKLNVVYKTFGANTPSVHCEVMAVPPGAWKIVEHGTRPHKIPRDRRGKQKVLKFPDGGFARSVQHPGSRGKQPWSKAKAVVAPQAGRIYSGFIAAEMAALFGG